MMFAGIFRGAGGLVIILAGKSGAESLHLITKQSQTKKNHCHPLAGLCTVTHRKNYQDLFE